MPSSLVGGGLPLRLILWSIFLVLLLAPAAQAQDDVLYLAFSDTDLSARSLRSKATLALIGEGAGRVEPTAIQTIEELIPQQRAWLGNAPRTMCDSGQSGLTREAVTFGLKTLSDQILFGEFDQARVTADRLMGRLPCLVDPIDQAVLYRFWFLRGALEFTDGRLAKAEFELARAVLVDANGAFDATFPEAFETLLAKVRRDVLRRTSAQVAIALTGAKVWVDGSPLALEADRRILSLPLGTHLIQVERNNKVEGALIELSGLSVRANVPVLAILDKPSLAMGLGALAGDEAAVGWRAQGRAAILCWLAEKQASWALLVQHRKGKMAAVLQADLLSATVRSFRKGPTRGDIYTLRARLGFRGGYRLLRVGGPDVVVDEYRHYGTVSVMIWSRLSWLLRIGGELGFGHTPNPEAAVGDEKCCFLPQGAVRLRLEQPTGTFRPFGEIGLLLLAPYGQDDAYIAVPGFEILGGVVVTPEPTRRIGIEIGAGFGIAPQLGNWVSLRAGPEVRF
jgi:hypothetical protein